MRGFSSNATTTRPRQPSQGPRTGTGASAGRPTSTFCIPASTLCMLAGRPIRLVGPHAKGLCGSLAREFDPVNFTLRIQITISGCLLSRDPDPLILKDTPIEVWQFWPMLSKKHSWIGLEMGFWQGQHPPPTHNRIQLHQACRQTWKCCEDRLICRFKEISTKPQPVTALIGQEHLNLFQKTDACTQEQDRRGRNQPDT